MKVFDYKNNLLNYQKNCFLYLHITDLDAMPRSILECMSFRKPVVASNKFGIKEIISNNINGFLINNKNELYNKMVYLLDDKNYKKISLSSFSESKKYSHQVVRAEFMDIINAY